MLKQTSLIDQIVTEIEEKISAGEFKNGDMLASQDELAKNHGCEPCLVKRGLQSASAHGPHRDQAGPRDLCERIDTEGFHEFPGFFPRLE